MVYQRQKLEVGIHVLLQCCLNVVCPLQVWLEDDVELYDFAKVRPLIKKKQVKVTVTHSWQPPDCGILFNSELSPWFKSVLVKLVCCSPRSQYSDFYLTQCPNFFFQIRFLESSQTCRHLKWKSSVILIGCCVPCRSQLVWQDISLKLSAGSWPCTCMELCKTTYSPVCLGSKPPC